MQDKEVAQFIEQESFLNYCFKRNDEDIRYWEKWLTENPEHVLQVEAMKQMLILMAEESRDRLKRQHFSELEERIAQSKFPQVAKRIVLWPRIVAAASIILAVSFSGYFLLHTTQLQQTAYYKNDIPPGHNQATLTLANGKKIILTKGLSGKLAQQGNTLIGVNSQNAVAYTATGANANLPAAYNTLSTAIGEQSPYPLVLADGTKVWLDARSSITFPVVFNGKDRIVKITGEAYFEVAHNNDHPFKVTVKDQTIEDIGTHFNINAYTDEKVIKTTLLEGAVKVSAPASSSPSIKTGVKLKPGQQSILNNNTLNVANADIEETMAWKNGYFRFNNEKIESIMRKLSRWYDIDVQYSGIIPDEEFYATSSRYRNISEVLTMLQKTKGVHFKVEGRRVTVMQ
jgi:transmembrane sensor